MTLEMTEQIFQAIRAWTSATIAEAESATKAITCMIDQQWPHPYVHDGAAWHMALAEAVEFAEQDGQALTPAGETMVQRWRDALAQAQKQVPAAWRYRYNGQWYLSQSKSFALNGFDLQPLYAAPEHRPNKIGKSGKGLPDVPNNVPEKENIDTSAISAQQRGGRE